MKFLSIKISRWEEILYGIFLREDKNWLVIKKNPGDYLLDGVSFINKSYIKKINEPFDKTAFRYKVFMNKFQNYNDNTFDDLDIRSMDSIFKNIYNKEEIIELGLENSDYVLIGFICKMNEKSFALEMYSTSGNFLKIITIKYSNVRTLTLNTDYLNSIKDFLKKKT